MNAVRAPRARSLLAVGGALWQSSHPGPALVVTALSLALGVVAGLDPARCVLLVAAVFAGQLSVGLSNDALDARRDAAVGRTDKPVASGAVPPAGAMAVAVVAVAAAMLLSAPLGAPLVAAHAVALAAAWAYNAGLKATPASVVPFVVSFGLLPSLATLSRDVPVVAAAWATAAGALLGVAVHLTNVLPDLDDDRRTGIRGLPQRLGATTAMLIAVVAVVCGAVAVLLGPVGGRVAAVTPLAWICVAGVVALGVVATVRTLRGRADRTVFRLVMAAALLLAAQLVAGGQSILG